MGTRRYAPGSLPLCRSRRDSWLSGGANRRQRSGRRTSWHVFHSNLPNYTDFTAPGKVGNALSFDGAVHVRVPDSAAMKPVQITLERGYFPQFKQGTLSTRLSLTDSPSRPQDQAFFLKHRPGV